MVLSGIYRGWRKTSSKKIVTKTMSRKQKQKDLKRTWKEGISRTMTESNVRDGDWEDRQQWKL